MVSTAGEHGGAVSTAGEHGGAVGTARGTPPAAHDNGVPPAPGDDQPAGNNKQQSLSALALSCAALFEHDVSEVGQRLAIGLTSLANHYQATAAKADAVRRVCRQYDFSEAVPGNGYRSFVDMFDKMVNASHETCLKIRNSAAVGRRAPSRKECAKDVEAWCQWMVSIGALMDHLQTLISWSEPGSLFPSPEHSPMELLKQAEHLNQYCFYGRMMGSQYCPSMQATLLRIAVFMCMYSHYFYNTGSAFRRWATASVNFHRIMTDPEYRAKRIVNISRYADVDFCKGFWSQQENELLQMYPEVTGPATAVNVTVGLPPETLVLPRTGGGGVSVRPPTVHIGPDSVHCRLLSTRRRQGMLGSRAGGPAKLPPSPCLLVHCHGGGFVAQSSKSHEVYLREWARSLDVPIFSVDYSLAPEAPFPRAADEAFYAYCWAVNNCRLLGSTGERIVVAGDSAGGNLVTTVTLQAIRRQVRVPDGQFLVYTPFNTSFTPSAARLLCLMDPVLPLGFLMRCLHAYVGHARLDAAAPQQSESARANEAVGADGHGEADVKEAASTDGDRRTEAKKLPNSDNTEGAGADVKEAASADGDRITEAEKLPNSDNTEGAGADVKEAASADGDRRTEAEKLPNSDNTEGAGADVKEAASADGDRITGAKKSPNSDNTEGARADVKEAASADGDRITGAKKSPNSGNTEGAEAEEPADTDSSGEFEDAGEEPDAEGGGRAEASYTLNPKRRKLGHTLANQDLDTLVASSLAGEIRYFEVEPDPRLSPLLERDDVLSRCPPTRILTCHLDPCLDDCVSMARRWRRLGVPVGLTVLDGVSHGFLNFARFSPEAQEGSRKCVELIRQLLMES